ncbi:MAG: hypothetical protein P4L83_21975 [Nevskia sp.]|nr:hypothetical protein [Nevskia sp.]
MEKMETIPFQRFRGRLEYLQQHMQVVDVAITKLFTQTQGHHGQGGTILDALQVNSPRYDRLRHPVNQDARVFNFSRSRNIEHALISLYRYFSEYMQGLLAEIYVTNPMVVVGKAPGSLQYPDIVKLGSFDAIAEKMIGNVFRKLEDERSTVKLLDKILDHTGVHPDPAQTEAALMYLEMRHLFVHNHGKADEGFVARYGAMTGLALGQRLPTKFQTARSGINAVETLLKDIDTQMIATGFARATP